MDGQPQLAHELQLADLGPAAYIEHGDWTRSLVCGGAGHLPYLGAADQTPGYPAEGVQPRRWAYPFSLCSRWRA